MKSLNEPQPPAPLSLPGAWAQFIQSVGFPVAFLVFLCVMAARYVPPVVDAHVVLLQRTGDAIESIDKSLRQNAETMATLTRQCDTINKKLDYILERE